MSKITPEQAEELKRRVIANGGSVGDKPVKLLNPAHCTNGALAKAIADACIPKNKPRMNKTETEFHEILKRRHPVIRPMAIRIELADRCTYLPDFYCKNLLADPLRPIFYEVKGAHIWEDGWVKIKMAARLYPEFTFILAQKKKGIWTETIVKP